MLRAASRTSPCLRAVRPGALRIQQLLMISDSPAPASRDRDYLVPHRTNPARRAGGALMLHQSARAPKMLLALSLPCDTRGRA